MTTQELIRKWFECRGSGDHINIPVTESFGHTSPLGTIHGKKEYLDQVNRNKDKFLGYRFMIIDEIIENNKATVRNTAFHGEFKLDVSEWYYIKDGLIDEIIAYYHIGEIRDDRKLITS
jgi:hypothetical protein